MRAVWTPWAHFRLILGYFFEEKYILEFSQVLDDDDKGKRMLYVMPESIGDIYLSTSLFRSAKELYPDYNLYVAVKKEYFPILEANPYIHKVIPYVEQMDKLHWLEGQGDHEAFLKLHFYHMQLPKGF